MSAKSIIAMTLLVEFRHWGLPMKGIILFVAGLAMIFVASAVQTFGTNWLGQVCPYPGPCFHPEWLAFGVALAAAAYIAWKVDRRRN
jgi:cytochrome b subunit of formate dehydrogenase